MGQPHGSGARPPSNRAALGQHPYFKGLRAGGLGSLIWQPPPPPTPRSARRARPAQAARSPTSPCQGGTERAGACGALTSPSTVTSLRNPVRARGGAARSTGPRRRGRKSYVDLEARPEETRRRRRARPPQRSKQIQCRRRGFPIARPITNVPREPEGRRLGDPTGGPEKYQRLWGWAHFGSTAETLHTIGRYSC